MMKIDEFLFDEYHDAPTEVATDFRFLRRPIWTNKYETANVDYRLVVVVAAVGGGVVVVELKDVAVTQIPDAIATLPFKTLPIKR